MIGNSWDIILKDEYDKEYFKNLQKFIIDEYKHKIVYPKMSEIFKAFIKTTYDDVKVVILGQDPYHGENEAEGLSFSVKIGINKPPSLVNIFTELKNDLGCKIPNNGSLVPWADQGVLLLNSTLTVIKDRPKSHSNKGWEIFTDEIIKLINKKTTPVVFILWGSDARSKKNLITNNDAARTIKDVKAELDTRLRLYGKNAWIADVEQAINDSIVQLDDTNPNRFNINPNFELSGVGRVYDITNFVGFYFGTAE